MKRLTILSLLCVLILAACQPAAAPATEVPAAAPATEVPTAAPATEVPTAAPATEVPTAAPATEEPAATAAPAADAPSAEERIANAVSAAPTVIGKDATILDWPTEEGGPMVVLREGSNGWTCITDWPASPGNDPMCIDDMFAKWNDALGAGAPLTVDRPGVAYMLAGGSDASNTDPFAMAPAAGEDWISTPAHVMLLSPGGFDAANFSATPKQDEPYIMWDGTPYEHLMVPVTPISLEAMSDVSAEMQNTMSAGPAGIVKNATIMGNPTVEGGEMVVLQEGTNGWTCYPDLATSPGNDPACNDPISDAGFMTGAARTVPSAGLSYMLAGGSDASNTDPMATSPAPGEDWVTSPAHLMFMVPGGFDTKYFTTDHMSGYPYIMWAGTDLEHIMIPVADMPME
ncbi:MAG TPA: hypothetical protein PKM78_01250 [Anaerolineae bacterium]|nr:hypothetical protein [Anaerolineae bacterium]